MSFPESPRVIYEHNPLTEVICQLRFPVILKIEANLPDEYQEKIRGVFPIFEEKPSGPEIPEEVLRLFPNDLIRVAKGRLYRFATSDNKWAVTLGKDFVALVTNDYERWEEFRDKLAFVIDSFLAVYNPAYYTRIGLRYQNVIHRSQLGLDQVEWTELLKPWIAGELGADDHTITKLIEDIERKTLYRFPDDSHIRVNHGYVVPDDDDEMCYKIDTDLFAEGEIKTNDVFGILDKFNKRNRAFFSWCITEKLHQSMEPRNIDETT